MKTHEGQHRAYDRKALLKDFDSLLTMARIVGSKYFEDEAFEQIAHQSRVEYEKIIPVLPYVGGKKSLFTNLMIQSGQTIAFHRACKNRGLERRQIGELLYEIVEAQMQSVSRIKKWFARRLLFTRSYRKRWKTALEESQSREFPKNWVGEFVEGNGSDFEYGFDFLECGFLKLARESGCEEIAPYVCLSDYARMRGIGVGFRRTQTLAMGHFRCDFRFSRNYETPRAWPPESLDEFRNSPLGNNAV
ncbi:MAG: L-2-amino-thiazoline-4-carboxylic acid hydrolase [Candidatus Thorarchaeota archaeon]